ncbi:MAG: ADP-ribosylglycohydrolase family protein [Planctomycetota bacterium]
MLPLERAKLSLDGLSVGDAFGEKFFGVPERVLKAIMKREVPESPWFFTDDTVMALGIVEVLEREGSIQQDRLAEIFARNYQRDPQRGYGGMAHRILQDIGQGFYWKRITHQVFDGMGSYGNGGAMRVAPVGAFFAEDFDQVVEQSRRSAEVTHGHPEGQAGAIAVAVAAAWAYQHREKKENPIKLLEAVLKHTPEGQTREGIEKALSLPFSSSILKAAILLGAGNLVSAQDTVPFCLWCSARHLYDYSEALWSTVTGLGDRDTTCAIVGGIVSLSTGYSGIPEKWLSARESLMDWK